MRLFELVAGEHWDSSDGENEAAASVVSCGSSQLQQLQQFQQFQRSPVCMIPLQLAVSSVVRTR